jgi:hypothetical protein
MYASCMTSPPEKTRRAIPYVVLVFTSAASWSVIGEFDAPTPTEARRQAAKEHEGETFVAVPARFWKPKTRKVEQVPKESWS